MIEKPNDWIATRLFQRDWSIDQMFDNGITPDNTGIKDEDYYKNIDAIKQEFTLPNGKFDEVSYHDFYKTSLDLYNTYNNVEYTKKIFNEFGQDPYAWWNTSGKTRDVSAVNIYSGNGLMKSEGIAGIGEEREGPYSIREIAEMQEAKDENGNGLGWSPNDRGGLIKGLFRPTLALAVYEEDTPEYDDNGNLIGYHAKGDLKYNEDGAPYYETVKGKDLYGRETLKWADTFTREGSWINKIDFFDSDDKHKSMAGSAARTVAVLAPLFMSPAVGTVWGSIRALKGFAQFTALAAKAADALITNDTDDAFGRTMKNVENYLSRFDSSKSDYAMDHPWKSFETWSDIVGSSAGQLFEQQLVGSIPKYIKLANSTKDSIKIGRSLSLGYMALTSAQNMYDEGKRAGMDDRQASLFWAANAAALFGLMQTDYFRDTLFKDTWLDDNEGRKAAWKVAQELVKDTKKAAKPLAAEAAKNITEKTAEKTVAKGVADAAKGATEKTTEESTRKLFKAFKDLWTDHIKKWFVENGKTIGNSIKEGGIDWLYAMMSEGTEEVMEEITADILKGASSALESIGVKMNKERKPLDFGFSVEDMLNRYLMNFAGGAVGGAVFKLKHVWDNRKYGDPDYRLQLTNIIAQGYGDDIKEYYKIWHDEGKLGSQTLSGTKFEQSAISDSTVALPYTQKSQNDIIYETLVNDVDTIEALLKSHDLYGEMMKSTKFDAYIKNLNTEDEQERMSYLLHALQIDKLGAFDLNIQAERLVNLQEAYNIALKTINEHYSDNESSDKKAEIEKLNEWYKKEVKNIDDEINNIKAGNYVGDYAELALMDLNDDLKGFFGFRNNIESLAFTYYNKNYDQLNDLEKSWIDTLHENLSKEEDTVFGYDVADRDFLIKTSLLYRKLSSKFKDDLNELNEKLKDKTSDRSFDTRSFSGYAYAVSRQIKENHADAIKIIDDKLQKIDTDLSDPSIDKEKRERLEKKRDQLIKQREERVETYNKFEKYEDAYGEFLNDRDFLLSSESDLSKDLMELMSLANSFPIKFKPFDKNTTEFVVDNLFNDDTTGKGALFEWVEVQDVNGNALYGEYRLSEHGIELREQVKKYFDKFGKFFNKLISEYDRLIKDNGYLPTSREFYAMLNTYKNALNQFVGKDFRNILFTMLAKEVDNADGSTHYVADYQTLTGTDEAVISSLLSPEQHGQLTAQIALVDKFQTAITSLIKALDSQNIDEIKRAYIDIVGTNRAGEDFRVGTVNKPEIQYGEKESKFDKEEGVEEAYKGDLLGDVLNSILGVIDVDGKQMNFVEAFVKKMNDYSEAYSNAAEQLLENFTISIDNNQQILKVLEFIFNQISDFKKAPSFDDYMIIDKLSKEHIDNIAQIINCLKGVIHGAAYGHNNLVNLLAKDKFKFAEIDQNVASILINDLDRILGELYTLKETSNLNSPNKWKDELKNIMVYRQRALRRLLDVHFELPEELQKRLGCKSFNEIWDQVNTDKVPLEDITIENFSAMEEAVVRFESRVYDLFNSVIDVTDDAGVVHSKLDFENDFISWLVDFLTKDDKGESDLDKVKLILDHYNADEQYKYEPDHSDKYNVNIFDYVMSMITMDTEAFNKAYKDWLQLEDNQDCLTLDQETGIKMALGAIKRSDLYNIAIEKMQSIVESKSTKDYDKKKPILKNVISFLSGAGAGKSKYISKLIKYFLESSDSSLEDKFMLLAPDEMGGPMGESLGLTITEGDDANNITIDDFISRIIGENWKQKKDSDDIYDVMSESDPTKASGRVDSKTIRKIIDDIDSETNDKINRTGLEKLFKNRRYIFIDEVGKMLSCELELLDALVSKWNSYDENKDNQIKIISFGDRIQSPNKYNSGIEDCIPISMKYIFGSFRSGTLSKSNNSRRLINLLNGLLMNNPGATLQDLNTLVSKIDVDNKTNWELTYWENDYRISGEKIIKKDEFNDHFDKLISFIKKSDTDNIIVIYRNQNQLDELQNRESYKNLTDEQKSRITFKDNYKSTNGSQYTYALIDVDWKAEKDSSFTVLRHIYTALQRSEQASIIVGDGLCALSKEEYDNIKKPENYLLPNLHCVFDVSGGSIFGEFVEDKERFRDARLNSLYDGNTVRGIFDEDEYFGILGEQKNRINKMIEEYNTVVDDCNNYIDFIENFDDSKLTEDEKDEKAELIKNGSINKPDYKGVLNSKNTQEELDQLRNTIQQNIKSLKQKYQSLSDFYKKITNKATESDEITKINNEFSKVLKEYENLQAEVNNLHQQAYEKQEKLKNLDPKQKIDPVNSGEDGTIVSLKKEFNNKTSKSDKQEVLDKLKTYIKEIKIAKDFYAGRLKFFTKLEEKQKLKDAERSGKITKIKGWNPNKLVEQRSKKIEDVINTFDKSLSENKFNEINEKLKTITDLYNKIDTLEDSELIKLDNLVNWLRKTSESDINAIEKSIKDEAERLKNLSDKEKIEETQKTIDNLIKILGDIKNILDKYSIEENSDLEKTYNTINGDIKKFNNSLAKKKKISKEDIRKIESFKSNIKALNDQANELKNLVKETIRTDIAKAKEKYSKEIENFAEFVLELKKKYPELSEEIEKISIPSEINVDEDYDSYEGLQNTLNKINEEYDKLKEEIDKKIQDLQQLVDEYKKSGGSSKDDLDPIDDGGEDGGKGLSKGKTQLSKEEALKRANEWFNKIEEASNKKFTWDNYKQVNSRSIPDNDYEALDIKRIFDMVDKMKKSTGENYTDEEKLAIFTSILKIRQNVILGQNRLDDTLTLIDLLKLNRGSSTGTQVGVKRKNNTYFVTLRINYFAGSSEDIDLVQLRNEVKGVADGAFRKIKDNTSLIPGNNANTQAKIINKTANNISLSELKLRYPNIRISRPFILTGSTLAILPNNESTSSFYNPKNKKNVGKTFVFISTNPKLEDGWDPSIGMQPEYNEEGKVLYWTNVTDSNPKAEHYYLVTVSSVCDWDDIMKYVQVINNQAYGEGGNIFDVNVPNISEINFEELPATGGLNKDKLIEYINFENKHSSEGWKKFYSQDIQIMDKNNVFDLLWDVFHCKSINDEDVRVPNSIQKAVLRNIIAMMRLGSYQNPSNKTKNPHGYLALSYIINDQEFRLVCNGDNIYNIPYDEKSSKEYNIDSSIFNDSKYKIGSISNNATIEKILNILSSDSVENISLLKTYIARDLTDNSGVHKKSIFSANEILAVAFTDPYGDTTISDGLKLVELSHFKDGIFAHEVIDRTNTSNESTKIGVFTKALTKDPLGRQFFARTCDGLNFTYAFVSGDNFEADLLSINKEDLRTLIKESASVDSDSALPILDKKYSDINDYIKEINSTWEELYNTQDNVMPTIPRIERVNDKYEIKEHVNPNFDKDNEISVKDVINDVVIYKNEDGNVIISDLSKFKLLDSKFDNEMKNKWFDIIFKLSKSGVDSHKIIDIFAVDSQEKLESSSNSFTEWALNEVIEKFDEEGEEMGYLNEMYEIIEYLKTC